MRSRALTGLAAACLLAALALAVLGGGAPAQEGEPDALPSPRGEDPALQAPEGAEPEEPDPGGERQGDPGIEGDPSLARGRELYLEGCSDCHGIGAQGIPGRAPSLIGVGEIAADFYLRTGRMPMADPEDQPRRAESPYTEEQIDALIAYVRSFGGPPIPEVHPERGSRALGLEVFTFKCAGCHQIVGQGGIMPVGVAPDLQVAEPIDVAEAVRIGPYVMPAFPDLTQHEIDSLAAYVEYTEDPQDRGGWGIGHLGPVPEGMVTWLLAAAVLLLVIRLIGERTTP